MRGARNNISVRKIAGKAGVSAAIVSAVLCEKDGKKRSVRFSSETARRVREIANEMGYIPNRLFKVLLGKEPFAIGVLLPFEKHERYESIVRALSDRCQEKGYHLIVTSCGFSHEEQMRKLRSLLSLQVDGVVMIPAASERVDPAEVMAEHWEKAALCPSLLCVDWFWDNIVFDCVEPDERLLVELPLRHLHERGHRFVGLIGACSPRRHQILMDVLSKLGMQETAETAMAGFSSSNLFDGDIPGLVRLALNRSPRPTALYCWRDSFAAMAYRVCEREYGLNVGRDIAIVGQDDTMVAKCLPVPLSSLDLRNGDLAATLFQLVEDKIVGRREDVAVCKAIEPQLIVRESSDFIV